MPYTDTDRAEAAALRGAAGQVIADSHPLVDFYRDPASFTTRDVDRAYDEAEHEFQQLTSEVRSKVNSGQIFEPGYLEAEAVGALQRWRNRVLDCQEHLMRHIDIVERAQADVDEGIKNPALNWTPQRKATMDQATSALLRDLNMYGMARLEGQARAALSSGRTELLVEWMGAIVQRQVAINDAPDAIGEATRLVEWGNRFEEQIRKDADPATLQLKSRLERRHKSLTDALADVRKRAHPRNVDVERAHMRMRPEYAPL